MQRHVLRVLRGENVTNQKSEWSEWDERHGRQRREGSGRVRREVPRYKSEIIHSTYSSRTRTTSFEPAQLTGRTADEPPSAISHLWSEIRHASILPICQIGNTVSLMKTI